MLIMEFFIWNKTKEKNISLNSSLFSLLKSIVETSIKKYFIASTKNSKLSNLCNRCATT